MGRNSPRHGSDTRTCNERRPGTARLITAAAAAMICVFGSFVLSDLRVPKLVGFVLAVAVFIDATVVRLVLVPATMELLGDRNWWFPKALEWFRTCKSKANPMR
jgi:putative drug exporter of the RND superfamily